MNLARMSFKGYVWPRNPETIQIGRGRSVAEFQIPQGARAVQDNGAAPRKVTGSGRFTGAGAMEEFSRLSAVFSAGGSGTLRLPGTAPFQAVFASLVLKGQPRPNCAGYEFTFLEDSYAVPERAGEARVFVCSGGETLWDVANRYGTDVDTLRAANPQIEWPNALAAGEEVNVP
ncbi:MAG: LysM peptidoglycan-binding domain-containing protein [Oscillospiraceae bacterium]|jgi:hypothetical protein|nr:LysM peptidoglycan-binding domain-containing protein [Oscillospiraceae bacterium]MCI1990244.1 LysM peptidoglycan-binding domain-containing protein [Oscillospiraceae bacterium]MCI2035772.1 LysM peptidoglycan-binding domain-containing protein [Oscillospiraceae bacterium]